jgi:hypothetical protein
LRSSQTPTDLLTVRLTDGLDRSGGRLHCFVCVSQRATPTDRAGPVGARTLLKAARTTHPAAGNAGTDHNVETGQRKQQDWPCCKKYYLQWHYAGISTATVHEVDKMKAELGGHFRPFIRANVSTISRTWIKFCKKKNGERKKQNRFFNH